MSTSAMVCWWWGLLVTTLLLVSPVSPAALQPENDGQFVVQFDGYNTQAVWMQYLADVLDSSDGGMPECPSSTVSSIKDIRFDEQYQFGGENISSIAHAWWRPLWRRRIDRPAVGPFPGMATDFVVIDVGLDACRGFRYPGDVDGSCPLAVLRDIPCCRRVWLDRLDSARRTLLEAPTSPARRLHGFFGDSVDRRSISRKCQVESLWDAGVRGKGVRVGVFDTGLRKNHPAFADVEERTNWTDEPSLDDGVGHGTFVAGIIASRKRCTGMAPDATLVVFRVFTSQQKSFSSWFLDAFNYAMHIGIEVVNLSIGGPDFSDQPFIDKVWEVSSHGIVLVSASGNDGPRWGSHNNPADQMDVVGVGGIDFQSRLMSFSSRGMTTWPLARGGMGQAKPDLVTYADKLLGLARGRGTSCIRMSGTSVASPVVAGAIALLASAFPEDRRHRYVNVASMKQILMQSAVRLPRLTIFEQGAGRMDVPRAYALAKKYVPTVSVHPESLDLMDQPYMWPYTRMPVYYSAVPLCINMTLYNAITAHSVLEDSITVVFEDIRPADASVTADQDTDLCGTDVPLLSKMRASDYLSLTFEYSRLVSPYSGYFAVYFSAPMPLPDCVTGEDGVILSLSDAGLVMSGHFVLSVLDLGGGGTGEGFRNVKVPFRVRVIPPPPKPYRVLWDHFRNIPYPPAYIPRDNLNIKRDVLDWNGDHPFTNFKDVFDALTDAGYFVEISAVPYTCIDLSLYGTMILVDPEEEFSPSELRAALHGVVNEGLSVLVFPEWYNRVSMHKSRFFDDNTRRWWTSATGGANIPAINDLLNPLGISFSNGLYDGVGTVPIPALEFARLPEIAMFLQRIRRAPVATADLQGPRHNQANGPDVIASEEEWKSFAFGRFSGGGSGLPPEKVTREYAEYMGVVEGFMSSDWSRQERGSGGARTLHTAERAFSYQIASATGIGVFPAGGRLHNSVLKDHTPEESRNVPVDPMAAVRTGSEKWLYKRTPTILDAQSMQSTGDAAAGTATKDEEPVQHLRGATVNAGTVPLKKGGKGRRISVPIVGIMDYRDNPEIVQHVRDGLGGKDDKVLSGRAGRVAVTVDAGCFDQSNRDGQFCRELLLSLVRYTAFGVVPSFLKDTPPLRKRYNVMSEYDHVVPYPLRPSGRRLDMVSKVSLLEDSGNQTNPFAGEDRVTQCHRFPRWIRHHAYHTPAAEALGWDLRHKPLRVLDRTTGDAVRKVDRHGRVTFLKGAAVVDYFQSPNADAVHDVRIPVWRRMSRIPSRDATTSAAGEWEEGQQSEDDGLSAMAESGVSEGDLAYSVYPEDELQPADANEWYVPLLYLGAIALIVAAVVRLVVMRVHSVSISRSRKHSAEMTSLLSTSTSSPNTPVTTAMPATSSPPSGFAILSEAGTLGDAADSGDPVRFVAHEFNGSGTSASDGVSNRKTINSLH